MLNELGLSRRRLPTSAIPGVLGAPVLAKERPVAVGLAVPAMPRGSPGMDGPEHGGQRDPFEVLLVRRDGSARVYQAYR